MELVAGDGGLLQLAVCPDGLHDAAQLVVLLDGLAQRLVGGIHAVVVPEKVQHVGLQLPLIVVDAVDGLLERHVRELALEPLVVDDAGHPLQMLLEPAGHGTRLRGQLGVQKVEAALQRPLQQTASVVTGAGGHVVRRHVRRGAAGRTEPHGEAARQIQQHLRHEVAGVAQRQPAVVAALLDKVVVCLLQ